MTDICLLLEGTYPFTAGGVSTWIHQLISAMPDLRFSILHIAPLPNPNREYKYKLPGNVVDIQDLFLHDVKIEGPLSPRAKRLEALERLANLHLDLFNGRLEGFKDALPYLRDPKLGLTLPDMFRSEEAWHLLVKIYQQRAEDVSFLDFFWSWRSIYVPLLKTLQCPLPAARLYHTVSTGYAGLLSSIAHLTQDSQVLLTEHGVYTHERLLEISQATWIYSPHRERFRVQRELSFFKRLWLGFFDVLGKLTYQNADRIITLFEGNKAKQIASGAPADKISLIPNGIDVEHYAKLAAARGKTDAPTVAFIGRVVPIKDVKTFLHAAKMVKAAIPAARFILLGPTDEEAEYTQECKDLCRATGLDGSVKFLGKADMKEWYPKIDLVVLTSLSEAQPYVLLEANAAGIPVVATDVGACREMLEGRTSEDRRLGPSGLLTGVAHPEGTAAAITRLLTDRGLWTAMAEAGQSRVRRYYDQTDLISRYLNLYEKMMR